MPKRRGPVSDDARPEQPWKDHRFDEFSLAVGWIAGLWAQIEAALDEAIWVLADVDPGIGACVTPHIGSIGGRVRAFLSLLRYRGASEEIADDWNQLLIKIENCGRQRNRYVHDPIARGSKSNTIFRRHVTADRRLEFKYPEASLVEMELFQNKLQALSTQLHEKFEQTRVWLPPSPRRSP